MALRSLLGLIEDDPAATALAREGGHAFVSASLRPYMIAALCDRAPDARASSLHPTLVVVGDDRAARDLAADLRAWLAPRRVRYYPSRGVAYESHLAPPPHLVGLRVAALDALLAAGDGAGSEGPPGGESGLKAPPRSGEESALGDTGDTQLEPPSWSSPRWRCRRRSPTRSCGRARSRCAWASCSTWMSARGNSSRQATNGSSRSRSAASSPCAEGCSTCSRPPRIGPCGWTCSTSRSNRCAGSRPSPSARSGMSPRSRSRPPPSSRSSTVSWRRSPPAKRGPIAPTSPSCCPSSASARCWTCSTIAPSCSSPPRRR